MFGNKPHRFVGLAKRIRRILLKWDVLECWFCERVAKAIRDGVRDIPAGFPLADDKATLEQIHSLLVPVERVCKISQSEAANQVEVLTQLYTLQTRISKKS